MLYAKDNWDYFCNLLAVVPGMSAMFHDGVCGQSGTNCAETDRECQSYRRDFNELEWGVNGVDAT